MNGSTPVRIPCNTPLIVRTLQKVLELPACHDFFSSLTIVFQTICITTMSTTLMPFLYQTRTLCRFTQISVRRFLPPLTHVAGLHSSPPRAAWQPRNNTRGGYTSRREGGSTETIPFELPHDVDLTPEGTAGGEQSDRVDTITPSERRAFKSIFLEIADRGEAPLSIRRKIDQQRQEGSENKRGVSRFLESLVASKTSMYGRESSINAIMQNAAENLKQVQSTGIPGLDPLSPLESMYSAADRQQALLKFPPSLRNAARVAYGVVGGDHSTSVRVEGGDREKMAAGSFNLEQTRQDPVDSVGVGKHSELTQRLKLEADRRTERLRIRNLMTAAQTDTELWDIMESEVFTLVKRLGLESELQLRAPKAKRGRKPKGTQESKTTEQAKLLNPETYGPVYPMLLFEGVHLFNTKFPRPSPYIFHVLPRIKDLGLMSYVLGVSTSFYNQLMSIVWERYGDAAGVLNLMEEMRHAGLYFDQQTQKLLRNIAAVYQNADKGEYGPFVKMLMDMPEFEPILLQRLNHWQKQVSLSIRHQMQATR